MVFRILQKTGIVICLLLFIYSCSNDDKQIIKEKERKINELEAQLDNIIMNDRYKQELISTIEENLESIDSTFLYLNLNREAPIFDEKAEKIFSQIKNLKQKIDSVEKELLDEMQRNNQLTEENKSLLKIIQRYKSTLIEKEQQILTLSKTVKEHEITISNKNNEIAKKNNEIEKKKKEVSQLKKDLIRMEAEAYDNLSQELYSIASNLPTVKGWFTKKTKEEISKTRRNLRNQADIYKSKANNLWKKYYE